MVAPNEGLSTKRNARGLGFDTTHLYAQRVDAGRGSGCWCWCSFRPMVRIHMATKLILSMKVLSAYLTKEVPFLVVYTSMLR